LKIVAEGEWAYSTNFANPCSANGDLNAVIDSKKCIHEKSPVGALIGKIGGSAADKDVTVFTVGEFCVHKIEDQTAGPLFLTINDTWNGFEDNAGELTVIVYVGRNA